VGGSYSQSTPSRSTRKCDLRALTRGVALVALAWLAVHSSARAEPSVLEVGRFSAAAEGAVLPPSWQPLEFKKIPRHTSYSLVRSDGVVVVRASSEASASGLVRRMRIDPRQYPVVQWRWKVEGLLEKGDVSSKKGDDYPARIYITFEYDPSRLGLFDKARFEAVRLLYGEYPPFAAITYIWEGHAPLGTIVPNAYTDRVKMIVVESGSARVGRWVSERRDLLADYRAAFGDEPPEISGVAIMTDTDNTGESVTAYFGDIVFLLAGAL
jgi:Protein of unknown function (DUF3047)